MMDPQELRRDIATNLLDEVNRQLRPGESILISLPGSFGEALVVTDRRAMVARERPTGLDLVSDVFAYPLTSVTGASVVPSSAGGFIELKLGQPVEDVEKTRVYYPLEEGSRFAAAAEYLNHIPTATAAPTPVASVSAGEGSKTSPPRGEGSTLACPKCGARLAEDSAFCGQCGAAVRAICAFCGADSVFGSKYCSRCGRGLIEFKPECVKCGARVSRSMLYCPECGSMQRAICLGCGGPITSDWTYCAYCGRRIGSGMDSCDSNIARRRIEGMRNREAERQSDEVSGSPLRSDAETLTAEPEPQASAPASDSAEAHNLRGTQLFESEDYEGAIREYSAAVLMEPNNSTYHCNLGMAYDEADRDAEALAEYEKTLELNPNDLTALMSLGYMYSEGDQLDRAQEVWGKVLRIAPDSAEAQEVRQNLRHQGEL